MGWQQITIQWWEECRFDYDLFISELVIAEVSLGSPDAAERRLRVIEGIDHLRIDEEVENLVDQLIAKGPIPPTSQADAIHIAAAAVHRIDYLLTWNCRHLNNVTRKPIIRKICGINGYACPEICTPLELLERR